MEWPRGKSTIGKLLPTSEIGRNPMEFGCLRVLAQASQLPGVKSLKRKCWLKETEKEILR